MFVVDNAWNVFWYMGNFIIFTLSLSQDLIKLLVYIICIFVCISCPGSGAVLSAKPVLTHTGHQQPNLISTVDAVFPIPSCLPYIHCSLVEL